MRPSASKSRLFSWSASSSRRFTEFFFSSRRRHTRCLSDWSSHVCSSDLPGSGGEDLKQQSRTSINLHSFGIRGLASQQCAKSLDFCQANPAEMPGAATAPAEVQRNSHQPRSEERRVGKEGRSGGLDEQEG